MITHAQSGHTLFVKQIELKDLPKNIQDDAKEHKTFYVVKNWDDDGVVFMYLGKGYIHSPKQIMAWYPKGEMWSGFGKTIEQAINGAQKDGWMYA